MRLLTALVLAISTARLPAAERELLAGLRHLRIDGPREWADFPERPEAGRLVVPFEADANPAEHTLRLRQQDVKQTWRVLVNGRELGRLHRDENDIAAYFAVPAGTLVAGQNTLQIEQVGAVPDDVRVGEIRLDDRPLDAVLSESEMALDVREQEDGPVVPCRITILNSDGALQTVGAASNDSMAVRPGVIYCNGKATFGLPAGEYTLIVGRGFEYGAGGIKMQLERGGYHSIGVAFPREVPTDGWVACDTHVHTLTHSGHGDATTAERMLTIAGEGIELPIATDHNVHVDYEPLARQLGVRRYFTPVIGNEVTTKVGHFNVFPIAPGAPPPDFRLTEWDAIFKSIYATPDVKVCILNHARDIHSGVRPFGPKLHNALVGENLAGWRLQANAMEVVNSSAQQTDVMRLFHDWFGMLNRGVFLTPVGSSDSHDVARHFVGQGRTYIRVDDRDPGNIDVAAAVESFLAGRVVVSLGLFTEIEVNGRYGPGDVAPAASLADGVAVSVRVLGPSWTTADVVELYANGRRIREAAIPPADGRRAGVKSTVEWKLDDLPPGQDVFLVAIARGPGVRDLFWPIAKPYQPTSPEWTPHVLGATGAVWLDRDGNGRRTPAREYAEQIVNQSGGDLLKTLAALQRHDEAVAAHAAHLLAERGVSLTDEPAAAALKHAAPAAQRGFREYVEAWRETEIARSK
ncbi:MAG TPA: CehA/McbA family metallohydrolase [Planctomycetaceae bacterium]|nr:CehA/McbA family metallohydrolase [Planctomycetaceae bacterium]